MILSLIACMMALRKLNLQEDWSREGVPLMYNLPADSFKLTVNDRSIQEMLRGSAAHMKVTD